MRRSKIRKVKITPLENFLINFFTPLDYALHSTVCEKISPSGRVIKGRMAESKREDYRRLVYNLERYGYKTKIIRPYSESLCGVTQLFLAARRGLMVEKNVSYEKESP